MVAERLWTIIHEAAARRKDRALPQRIRSAIRQHGQAGEVLVKLIQLLVVAIWGALYAVAPKTDINTAFSPVPYALAAYFLLNALGLWWALKRPLPNWAVYLSIALDVGVLMVLIWSFHVQYRQPASFYLKAPTLLYVFIFVALRALRFEARFVLAAGLFAALGWLALVGYAIRSDPMVTRDYVRYMTSNSVLVGAEFDKIISILMVAAIIALALKRARDFLVAATAEGITARELSRFFDDAVASRIRAADHVVKPGEGMRREAAVLFIDIRGFTPLAARLDPGMVMAMLTAYQTRLVPIIHRHGGSIDKFLGDGIMASFGAVEASQTYAADALRALDAVLAETDGWQASDDVLSRLAHGAINGAVAAGPIVFGTLGNEERLEYTVIGAPVNLAAKLEKLNRTARSRAITDRPSFELACAQGFEPPRPPRRAKGLGPGGEDVMILDEAVRPRAPAARPGRASGRRRARS